MLAISVDSEELELLQKVLENSVPKTESLRLFQLDLSEVQLD
jgi:hypothetical protein